MAQGLAQPTLFRNSPAERFEDFHYKNPQVYLLLCERARELKAKGFARYSIRTLWELLRWHSHMTVKSSDSFTLNNNHVPYYARKIMQDESDLRGFFETRKLRGDDWQK